LPRKKINAIKAEKNEAMVFLITSLYKMYRIFTGKSIQVNERRHP